MVADYKTIPTTINVLVKWLLLSKMIKYGWRFGRFCGNLLPSSVPPSRLPSYHHCQIPQETHLKSHVHSLITLSLVREREAKGDWAKPRTVDCSGLISLWSSFVVENVSLSVSQFKCLLVVKFLFLKHFIIWEFCFAATIWSKGVHMCSQCGEKTWQNELSLV